jgi:PAS domain S-box-containing protein
MPFSADKTRPHDETRWGSIPGLLLFFAAFYAAYLYGMSFGNMSSAPFWPPDAILLSALLLTPRRTWWVYLLAPLLIRLLVATPPDAPIWFLLSSYVNDSLKAIASAVILRRLNKWDPRLENVQQLIQFFLVAVLAVPALSAFAGALSRVAIGDDFWRSFWEWFLGDSLVNLILTPMILFWALGGVASIRSSSNKRRIEAALLFAALILVGIKALSGEIAGMSNSSVLIYLPLPLLLYSAIRFGPGAVSSALSLIAIAAIWSAEHGLGPLSAGSPGGGDTLPLQLYLFFTSIPLHCVAVLMHEREVAVAKLHETMEQLARTESLSLVMATHVGLDGRWLKVPPTFCELVGRSEEELLGGYFKDITYPDDFQADWALCLRLIKGEIQSYGLEKRFIHKDGQRVWVYINCSVVSDVVGRPLYLLTYITDITERKLAEEALRESEQRFRTMSDTAPVLIWTSGADRLCTYVNLAWLEFTGRELEQELGNGWTDGIHSGDRDRSMDTFTTAFNVQKSFSIEYRLRRFDGEYRMVLATGVPRFTPDGSFIGYIGSATDITDLKLAEKKLQRLTGQLIDLQDEERRRIAAELHDSIGQSLVIIKHRAMICLRDSTGSDRMLGQLEEISSTATAAIDELHEIAHNLRPYELDRLGLVRAVETMVSKLSSSMAIRLHADIDRIDGLLSPAAETSVYRIIQEGLNNVIKHADAREATVKIRKMENRLVISVEDNGQGITVRHRDSDHRSGFGLAGIAERARMLGGTCVIESLPEKGTTLIVRIGLSEVVK